MMKKITPLLVLLIIGLYACKPNKPEEVIEEVLGDPTVELLDSLIQQNPKNADLYYDRAMYYYNQGLTPKALSDIYSALYIDSLNLDYIDFAGELFLEVGEGNKAISLIKKSINLHPENEDLYLKAIQYNIYMNNYPEALEFSNDLLEMNKYNADAYFLKGLIYKESNQENKAISTFQTCVEVDPTFYNAYMQLGLIYTKTKDDQAIQYFENALKIQENSREALYAIAYHFQSKEEYNKAIREYKQMVSLNSKDHEVFYNIGHCYIGVDSLDKAYSNFDIAIKIQPQYTGAYYMKGYVSELAGNIPDAVANYKQALNLLPDDPTISSALERVNSVQ